MKHQKLLVQLVAGLFILCGKQIVFAQMDFWQPTGLTTTIPILSIAIDSTGGNIFAGSGGGGVFRSNDNGDNWTTINTGFVNNDQGNVIVSSLAIDGLGNLFAGTHETGVFRSTNNGDSWTPTGLNGINVRALVVNGFNHAFAGTEYNGGVFRSTDSGGNWAVVNAGLTNENVRSLSLNKLGYVFAGTEDGGVFRSTNNGDNWMHSGLDSLTILDFAINSLNHLFTATGGGIYRSSDSGDNWEHIGADTLIALTLASDKLDHLFAGGAGVFRSVDNGDNWAPITSGLADSVVLSLAVSPSDYIFAGTLSMGIFRSAQTITSVDEIDNGLPKFFSLEQNYPNPFNPSTTISYDLPKRSHVIIKIYNLMGQEVARLVDQVKEAGSHQVIWNAQKIASGVYFYRIEAGEFNQTKKAVFLR